MGKFELHVHTTECDKYAGLGGAQLVRLYAEAGYDGMVITDHYAAFALNWYKDDFDPDDHKAAVHRYLRGYYAACEEAKQHAFTVLPGAEVRLPNTDNDYLIYGLQENDLYELPLLCRCKNLTELVSVLPSDVCVVQAHPFRRAMTLCDHNLLFGMEVYNYGTEAFRNGIAKQYAAHYGKAMTSGSDVHGSSAVAKGGIDTPRTIQTPQDLTAVLRDGAYTLIESPQTR
jgi:predicted metal-dependent phosphoesterase TrpH